MSLRMGMWRCFVLINKMTRVIALLLVVLVGLSGCKRETVVSYRIPKEEHEAIKPKVAPPAQMPGLADQTRGFERPAWSVPSEWEEKEAGPMRKGSFVYKDGERELEITVLAFPGDVGGMLANINRWAGQVEGHPYTQEQVDALESVEVDGNMGSIVVLNGRENGVLGVIVEMAEHTWFFKMMGPNELIQTQNEIFFEFLKSVRFR